MFLVCVGGFEVFNFACLLGVGLVAKGALQFFGV